MLKSAFLVIFWISENVEDAERINEAVPDLVFKLIRIANEFQFAEALVDRMYKL